MLAHIAHAEGDDQRLGGKAIRRMGGPDEEAIGTRLESDQVGIGPKRIAEFVVVSCWLEDRPLLLGGQWHAYSPGNKTKRGLRGDRDERAPRFELGVRMCGHEGSLVEEAHLLVPYT